MNSISHRVDSVQASYVGLQKKENKEKKVKMISEVTGVFWFAH